MSSDPQVPQLNPQPAPATGSPPAAVPTPGPDVDWGRHDTWLFRGHRCHWRVLGDPRHPPLLLLHGFGAGSGHCRCNAAALARAGWCVYGLDLLGFGASAQPSLRLDNRLWAQQVHAFLAQVVLDPAVVIGHSLGGLVALTAAVFHPTWIRAVVAAPLPDPSLLMATHRGPGSPRRAPLPRRLRRLGVELLCRLLPLELIVPLLAHSPLLDLGIQAAYCEPVIGDRDLHRVIARPARRPGAVRALRAMSIAMALRPHQATAPALLRRLERPLLLLWGRQDRLVPTEVADRCLRLRPDLGLHLIDGAGHCPHDEIPETFHALLLDWLAERLGVAAPRTIV